MYKLSLGRADTLAETPFQTARREAWEEIGLPNIGSPLPGPFAVEHLCEMPANLAKTELVVRPCIALLHAHDERTGESADPEVSLIPKLDAREVAAVFTAPFKQFLSMRDEGLAHPPDWYRGSWSSWHSSNWRSKSIYHTFRSSVNVKPMRVRSM
jgi:8-oxo-dGTP pyrophosphatase MutT (NUDIX family)